MHNIQVADFLRTLWSYLVVVASLILLALMFCSEAAMAAPMGRAKVSPTRLLLGPPAKSDAVFKSAPISPFMEMGPARRPMPAPEGFTAHLSDKTSLCLKLDRETNYVREEKTVQDNWDGRALLSIDW